MGKIPKQNHILGSEGKILFPVRLSQAFCNRYGARNRFDFTSFDRRKESPENGNVGWMVLEGIDENHGVQGDLPAREAPEEGGHFQPARSFLTGRR
jgi:hypothetical protein